MGKVLAWYFAPEDEKLGYGDGREIREGCTHMVDGKVSLCTVGLHGSESVLDALFYKQSSILYRVEISGNLDIAETKLCGTTRTYIKRYEISKDIWAEFSKKVALRNIHLVKEYCSSEQYEDILVFLKNPGRTARTVAEETRAATHAAWAATAATDAAWTAVRTATEDAVIGSYRPRSPAAHDAAAWAAARAAGDASRDARAATAADVAAKAAKAAKDYAEYTADAAAWAATAAEAAARTTRTTWDATAAAADAAARTARITGAAWDAARDATRAADAAAAGAARDAARAAAAAARTTWAAGAAARTAWDASWAASGAAGAAEKQWQEDLLLSLIR